MTRKLIYARFVQARAYDGAKRVEIDSEWCRAKDVERWLDRQVRSYKTFKARVANLPDHRPRLAYVVKVYRKEQSHAKAEVRNQDRVGI